MVSDGPLLHPLRPGILSHLELGCRRDEWLFPGQYGQQAMGRCITTSNVRLLAGEGEMASDLGRRVE